MKKLLPLLLLTALIYTTSCNNSKTNDSETDHSGHKTDEPKTEADSLMMQVMEGHDAVMPKMGKVRGAQKEAQRLLDSVSALPAKAQEAAKTLKQELETLINELNYADFAMDKWMVEFNMDSAKDNMEQRIQYLTDEKMKVTKVKEAVLNGLAKADSLLNKK